MRFLLLLLITFSSVLPQKTFAQETEKEETIATLNAKKEEVVQKEKEALKIEVLAINKRFENGELTEEEATILKKEAVANDINGYAKAPPSLRIWGGATVQNSDMKALLPWIDWAYNSVKNNA